MNRHALAPLIDRLLVASVDGDGRRILAARDRLDDAVAKLIAENARLRGELQIERAMRLAAENMPAETPVAIRYDGVTR